MTDLTGPERDALALLRSGRSFAEAMEISHLTFERIKALWDESQAQAKARDAAKERF